MRTVELNLSPEFYAALSEGDVGVVDPRLCAAIGFLSVWSNSDRFPKVTIHGSKTGDLTAHYYDKSGAVGYVIGGIPDDNWNYTFHS